MSSVDPIASVITVFQENVAYLSDDAAPVTENYTNNGLDVQRFPYTQKKQRIVPVIVVGPIIQTTVAPKNIGNTPNSRWEHDYSIECHLLTQTYQNPNVTGYNGMVRIFESIRRTIVENQTAVDGSGSWMLMKLSRGPYDGAGTTVTPDRYDTIFIVELIRQTVN